MSELPQVFNELLTPDECTAIDQTLLPTRDRFSIRVTVYSWRYLQQVSTALGVAIADLQPQQIQAWVQQDPSLQSQTQGDAEFSAWLSHLLTAALTPLQTIAHQEGTQIERLSFEQIVDWFKHQVNATMTPGA